MLPYQELFGGKIAIIRPLSYLEKSHIEEIARELDFKPVRNYCPHADSTKRDEVRNLLTSICDKDPNIKKHIVQTFIKTNNLRMAIVDEADEVLSTSFQKQIVKIFQKFKPEMGVQVCLFSATIPDEMFILTDKILNNPLKILVKDEEVSLEGIKQYYVFILSCSKIQVT